MTPASEAALKLLRDNIEKVKKTLESGLNPQIRSTGFQDPHSHALISKTTSEVQAFIHAATVAFAQDFQQIKAFWPHLSEPEYKHFHGLLVELYMQDILDVKLSENRLDMIRVLSEVFHNDYHAFEFFITCKIKLPSWNLLPILNVLKVSNDLLRLAIRIFMGGMASYCGTVRNLHDLNTHLAKDNTILCALTSIHEIYRVVNIPTLDESSKKCITIVIINILSNLTDLTIEQNSCLKYLAEEFPTILARCDLATKSTLEILFSHKSLVGSQAFLSFVLKLEDNTYKIQLLAYAAVVGYTKAFEYLSFFHSENPRAKGVYLNQIKSTLLAQYPETTIMKLMDFLQSCRADHNSDLTAFMQVLLPVQASAEHQALLHRYFAAVNGPLREAYVPSYYTKTVVEMTCQFGISAVITNLLELDAAENDIGKYRNLGYLGAMARFGITHFQEFKLSLSKIEEVLFLWYGYYDRNIYNLLQRKGAEIGESLFKNGFKAAADFVIMIDHYFVQKNSNTLNNMYHTSKRLFNELVGHIGYAFKTSGIVSCDELQKFLAEMTKLDEFLNGDLRKELIIYICGHLFVYGFSGVFARYQQFCRSNNLGPSLPDTLPDRDYPGNFGNNTPTPGMAAATIGQFGSQRRSGIELQQISSVPAQLQQVASGCQIPGQVQHAAIEHQNRNLALRFISAESYDQLLKLIDAYKAQAADEYRQRLKKIYFLGNHKNYQGGDTIVVYENSLTDAKLLFVNRLKLKLEAPVQPHTLAELIINLKRDINNESIDIESGVFGSRLKTFITQITAQPQLQQQRQLTPS